MVIGDRGSSLQSTSSRDPNPRIPTVHLVEDTLILLLPFCGTLTLSEDRHHGTAYFYDRCAINKFVLDAGSRFATTADAEQRLDRRSGITSRHRRHDVFVGRTWSEAGLGCSTTRGSFTATAQEQRDRWNAQPAVATVRATTIDTNTPS